VLDRYRGRIRRIGLHGSTLGAALNAGVSAAQSEFIAFLDSDDVWLPHKLSRQLAWLDGNDRFGFAYGNLRLLSLEGVLSPPVLAPEQIVRGSVLRTIVRGMCIHPSTLVVRRIWFERVGLFDGTRPFGEDYAFLLTLASHTEAVCDPEPVCLIRSHPGQANKRDAPHIYQATIATLEALLRRPGLSLGVRLEAHRSIARYHTQLARRHVEGGRSDEARRHALQALRCYPLFLPAWRWTLRSFGSR
jgi:glycosyltransferase involved in cell wall biosynthesis